MTHIVGGKAVLTCAILFFCGCATVPSPGLTRQELEPHMASEPRVQLEPGDELAIDFLYWPDLDVTQTIRPDGKISLHMAGEVRAAGLTPEQLHTELMELYRDRINDPEINVLVNFTSRRVFVGGEVQNPGVYPLQTQLTPLQAIIEAGGFINESARQSTVVVLREYEGQPAVISMDLSQPWTSDVATSFYLEPGDIVLVPRTRIDRLGQWVEQYVNQLVPRNLNFTFNRVLNSDRRSSRVSPVYLQLPSITR